MRGRRTPQMECSWAHDYACPVKCGLKGNMFGHASSVGIRRGGSTYVYDLRFMTCSAGACLTEQVA